MNRFLSAFLPTVAQTSDSTDKQMVIIHDRTSFSKTACSNIHPHSHVLYMCAHKHSVEFLLPLNARTEGDAFPPQSHSALHFCQGNPVGFWERSRAVASSEGPHCCLALTMKRRALIVSGWCFSLCFMGKPFYFKFFVLDKQRLDGNESLR